MNKFVVVAAVLLVGFVVVSGADDSSPASNSDEDDEEMPPLPPSHAVPPVPSKKKIRWLEAHGHGGQKHPKSGGIVKRAAGGCRNRYRGCICDYYKLAGHCNSRLGSVRRWMADFCKVSCGLCDPGPTESCENKRDDAVCEFWVKSRFQYNPRFQYTMACDCPKACGLCTAEEHESIDDAMASTAAFREECMRTHNQYRANHNAVALTWDRRSAEYAERVATELDEKNDGNMDHTPVRQRTWGGVTHGENLAYMTGITCQSGTDYWYEERDNYDPSNPVQSFLGGDVGHFTQIVWKRTLTVGCGKAGNYLACIYGPTGNRLSTAEFINNVDP
ncbi:ectin-like isoform X2 [Branchiostoma lanceolatum]|uniref:ectin-like isoform X2 n=1 Tax=Branchiostoma lanceolatum TaxID=7740 RepID=UPI0034538CEE